MNHYCNQADEIQEICNRIGIKDAMELFNCIPEEISKPVIELEDPLSEKEIKEKLIATGLKNKNLNEFCSFIGGAAYNHYIPSAVKAITGINSLYTAYTPYQAEISQGTLQYIFDFQSLICRLSGMEVANASMYDGASALAEAVLMANRINGKREILISKTLHPEYLQTCHTYISGKDLKINIIDYDNGITDLKKLKGLIDDNTSSVVVQTPNFFGCYEDLEKIKNLIKNYPDCLYIVVINNPMYLGLCNPPSVYGADIVVGEGQSFGNPLSFGGPYLGFFATKQKYLRQIPGRIVGKTTDSRDNPAYVLTFQTREQHIRKYKATSNICSNHSLNALAFVVYLSIVGEEGLRKLSNICIQRAHYLSEKVAELKNFKIKFSSKFFNEFVIHSDIESEKLLKALKKYKILGGINLERYFPELRGSILIAVTEMNSRKDIDRFLEALNVISNGGKLKNG